MYFYYEGNLLQVSSSSFLKEQFTYCSPDAEFQNVNYCELRFSTLLAACRQNSYSPVGSPSPGAVIFSEDKEGFAAGWRGTCGLLPRCEFVLVSQEAS